MLNPFLNILILDDDNHFAENQREILGRKLTTQKGWDPQMFCIKTVTRLDRINEEIKSYPWDIVFCDLGWGDFNLEGIQILNDFKMAHSSLFAVLYTAQDPEGETVSQALQWKLNFVDDIIPLDGRDDVAQMIGDIKQVFERKRLSRLSGHDVEEVITTLEDFLKDPNLETRLQLCQKEILETYQLQHIFPECSHLIREATKPSPQQQRELETALHDLIDHLDQKGHEHHIVIQGKRLLPREKRDGFAGQVTHELLDIQKKLTPLLSSEGENLAAEILVSEYDLSIKLKSDPLDQKVKKYNELIINRRNFPRVESHDLLALDKTRFIDFIKENYGGFPQMAEERGLDLNNIYRVNRKFKNLPFIVFKYETIMEIIGHKQGDELKTRVKVLLADERLIKKTAHL